MNERIRELAEQQAGAILMDLVMPDSGMPERVKWNVGITSEHLEKFAEMLINECISIVDEQKECLHEEQKYWHDRDYGYEMAVNDASNGIKQFFGVEL